MDIMENYYKTATELYSNSIRSLEQRATAFLTTQSLLVAAFAILINSFISDNSYISNKDLFLPILGIVVMGLIFSLIFYIYSQVTSEDAAFWRAYMWVLEDKISKEGPWNKFYEYMDKGKKQYAKKLPAPLLWLFVPALFLTAWICALIWIITLYFIKTKGIAICPCLWVIIIVKDVIIVGIIPTITYCRYRNSEENIKDKIKW